MAFVGKMEIEVEAKSCAETFFNTYRTKAHIVPKNSDDNIISVEVLEGDFESSTSVKQWTYKLDGKVETMKGKVEVDEENYNISCTTFGGEILKLYKSFKISIEVAAKGEGSLVKWSWEYEKISEDVPEPIKFQDLAANITKDVDAYTYYA